MSNILLVEDDPILGEGLKINLEASAHRVHWATSLSKGHQLNQSTNLDLVILDLNLPDGHGLEFCKKLRGDGSRLPIIVLTASLDEDTVVDAFDAGANDYFKKPFSQKELQARIRSALREPVLRDEQLRVGEILLLVDQRQVMYQGREIFLSRREFDLFKTFLARAGSVISREAIIQQMKLSEDISDRTVDSHISHLRKSLKNADVDGVQIKSEYGVGYRLLIDDHQDAS